MNADMATTKFDIDARQLNNNADIYGLHQKKPSSLVNFILILLRVLLVLFVPGWPMLARISD